jgi:hypothetical protein
MIPIRSTLGWLAALAEARGAMLVERLLLAPRPAACFGSDDVIARQYTRNSSSTDKALDVDFRQLSAKPSDIAPKCL